MISEISVGFTPWSRASFRCSDSAIVWLRPITAASVTTLRSRREKARTLPHVTEQPILRVFVESRRHHLNVFAGGALVRRNTGRDRERCGQGEKRKSCARSHGDVPFLFGLSARRRPAIAAHRRRISAGIVRR